MRKISLAILSFFFQLFSAFAQTDSSAYKARKLTVEEVNFVSAYYMQDGNNSAVTGGVGTEHLTDFANTLELRMLKQDKQYRQHSWGIEIGIDHYSSASSDKIDPATISSASHADTRIYPSVSWSMKNDKKNFTVGAVGSYSTEFDYKSYGIGLSGSKSSQDNNRELALKLQAYFDTWTVIYPIELRPAGSNKYSGHEGAQDYSPRNSYSASLTYSQVINQKLQMTVIVDGIYQSGLLATKYQRVYFINGSEKVENLPDKRTKLPIGIRGSYFIGNNIILRGFYRYYTDDWGITAHTAGLEMPVKISPFFSISPFYRYYTQTQADYFAPYAAHNIRETYYTSDYDLSAFNSQFFGGGLRFVPEHGVFKVKYWSSLELRYGHYIRSNGLHSDIITLFAKFK